MKKYINIIVSVFKFSLIRDMTFRVNFLFSFLITVFWQINNFFIAYVLASQFHTIGGWDSQEIFLLTAVARMINAITHFFFYPSFESLPSSVNDGSFDFYLFKPVNKLFLASVKRFGFNNFADAIINLVLVFIFAKVITIYSVVVFFLFAILAVGLQYFIWLSIVTLSFYTSRLQGSFDLFATLRSRGRFPKESYRGLNIVLFVLIIPFILMSTVPASFLAGKGNIVDAIIFLVLFVIIGVSAGLFWRTSIKRYSSASS